MEQKRLALIIPTQNRPACIHYYLETIIQSCINRNIDILIFDSSDTSDTRKITLELQAKWKSNLYYARYNELDDLRALDQKVYTACKLWANKYDYLWLSSDGTIFDIDRLWDRISAAMQSDSDIIALNHIHDGIPEERIYENSKDLLLDCGWSLTLMGGSIISTKNVRQAIAQFPVVSGKTFWLWHPFVYFYLFAGRDIKAVKPADLYPYKMNPFRTDAFWKENGDALWQWGKVWTEAVESLPAYYDDIKPQVLRSWDEHAHLFSIKGLLGLKAQGQIRYHDVRKYREYIPRITATRVGWFYFITLTCNRRLLAAIRTIYRTIKQKWRHTA